MPRWTLADLPDQTGRTAVVTGANAGLGLRIATALAGVGADVVLACRNQAKGEEAADRIRAVLPVATVTVEVLDLADLASVRDFADRLARTRDKLDLLVNNAGLMAVDESTTADGFETQLGVNHLGHHALTAQLLPMMRDVPGSRIATMSSLGHRAGRLVLDDLMFRRRGYQRWQAYFQSKLANLLFTADLHRRLTAAGTATIAVAAHPGVSHTDLGTEGTSLSNRLMLPVGALLPPPEAGAQPMLRAVTAPDVRGGEFYGCRFRAVGAAVRETPSRRARNIDDATALAAESARLTGIELPV